MPHAARILIADPDRASCLVTETCLTDAGYECRCVHDMDSAMTPLRAAIPDLMIVDLSAPDRVSLDLVRRAQCFSAGLPFIVLAESPTRETALDAVTLPVVAYLKKPYDPGVLLEHVRAAVTRHRVYRILLDCQRTMNDWSNYTNDLAFLTESQKFSPGDSVIKAYIATSLSSIVKAAADISRLLEALPHETRGDEPGIPLRSPRTISLEAALAEAVRVLEDTKQSFKSREIADLRKKLTSVLHAETPSPGHPRE